MHDIMVTYKPESDPEDMYKETFEKYIMYQFPQFHHGNKESIMESIIQEYLGTKQTRLGPLPNPESLVLMRSIVRTCVDMQKPIPILIPAAAIKLPVGDPIDLAELYILRGLNNLNERIRLHYEPGIQINIRLEDLTELVLSSHIEGVEQKTQIYANDMIKMVDVLGYQHIGILMESDFTTKTTFLEHVSYNKRLFLEYLNRTENRPREDHIDDPAMRELHQMGWYGIIDQASRNFFYDRYQRLYPEMDKSQYHPYLSGYYACILARRRLGAVGNAKAWSEWLEISYSPPRPDTPPVGSRVYYRSIPRNQSSIHIPFWGAKGVFRLTEKDEPRVTLLNWWDQRERMKGKLTLHSKTNRDFVTIQADYILE